MSEITTFHYLAVAATLLVLGVTGVLIRRNVVVVLMSIELILTAVNLNLVAFSRMWGNLHGQVFVLFLTAVAGAQAIVGLGIATAFFRNGETADLDEIDLLKW
jgi:NADH-quinone oxidoreductase subunit K